MRQTTGGFDLLTKANEAIDGTNYSALADIARRLIDLVPRVLYLVGPLRKIAAILAEQPTHLSVAIDAAEIVARYAGTNPVLVDARTWRTYVEKLPTPSHHADAALKALNAREGQFSVALAVEADNLYWVSIDRLPTIQEQIGATGDAANNVRSNPVFVMKVRKFWEDQMAKLSPEQRIKASLPNKWKAVPDPAFEAVRARIWAQSVRELPNIHDQEYAARTVFFEEGHRLPFFQQEAIGILNEILKPSVPDSIAAYCFVTGVKPG